MKWKSRRRTFAIALDHVRNFSFDVVQCSDDDDDDRVFSPLDVCMSSRHSCSRVEQSDRSRSSRKGTRICSLSWSRAHRVAFVFSRPSRREAVQSLFPSTSFIRARWSTWHQPKKCFSSAKVGVNVSSRSIDRLRPPHARISQQLILVFSSLRFFDRWEIARTYIRKANKRRLNDCQNSFRSQGFCTCAERKFKRWRTTRINK